MFPTEILWIVFKQTDPATLLQLRRVCLDWHDIIDSAAFCKFLFNLESQANTFPEALHEWDIHNYQVCVKAGLNKLGMVVVFDITKLTTEAKFDNFLTSIPKIYPHNYSEMFTALIRGFKHTCPIKTIVQRIQGYLLVYWLGTPEPLIATTRDMLREFFLEWSDYLNFYTSLLYTIIRKDETIENPDYNTAYTAMFTRSKHESKQGYADFLEQFEPVDDQEQLHIQSLDDQ